MRKNIVIIAILFLATILRGYSINSTPALNADEAALGYNAYSLIETGKDEHGNAWPINFQSFNDYKPGLYVYILIPFVKLLGLNIYSVRLPSLIFGVLGVLLIYLFTLRLTQKKTISSLAALVLATSPWHIHFSRGAWEVNLAATLTLAALYFFIVWVKLQNFKHLTISLVFFSLTFYAYQSARVITPLLVIGLILFYKKQLLKNFKKTAKSVLFGAVIVLPFLFDLLAPGRLARFSGVGLSADQGPISAINEARGEHGNLSSAPAKLFHNKPLYYFIEFSENYFEHFSGDFLFLSGDGIQRNKVPRTGQILLIFLPFTLIGLVQVLRKGGNLMFVLYWLIISPVAASLTFQSPHALRSQIMVLPLSILIAIGIYSIFDSHKKILAPKLFKAAIAIFCLGFVWNLALYLREYYIHMAKTYPFSSQYAVEELVSYITNEAKDKEKVIITTRYDQPYILLLFYTAYPPEKFQSSHTLTEPDKFGFSTVPSFDRYRFQPINWPYLLDNEKGSVVVAAPEEMPENVNEIHRVNFPNGSPAFIIVDN